MINIMSTAFVPVIVAIILIIGLRKKVNVFDCFTVGAKEGIEVSIRILPSLIGLIVGISVLRASGVIDWFSSLIAPFLDRVGFPSSLVPLALIRPVSGSASLAVVKDIMSTNGADSFVGRCASVMMGSTETTFYTLTVYLGSVGVNKSRYAIRSALLADLTGIITSVVFVRLLMY